jgi:carboxylesterase
MKSNLLKGAEPVFIKGNEIAILLLHGFTATPYEMSKFGNYLYHHGGYTISIPLLAGHGYGTDELNAVRYQDWIEDVRKEYERLKLSHTKIFIIGMSMGGALALDLASKSQVEGVIGIGTPTHLPPQSVFARFLSFFTKAIYKKDGADIADKEERNKVVSLKTIPLKALAELRLMLEKFTGNLNKITTPLLLFHSRKDHTISHKCMHIIASKVSSEIIQTHTYHKSYHILPLDYDKEDMFRRSLEFITSILYK